MLPESEFKAIGAIGLVAGALSAAKSLPFESLFASAVALSFAAFLASSNFLASSFFKASMCSLKYFSFPSLDNEAIFKILSLRCAIPSNLITSSRFSLFLVINLNSLVLEFKTVSVLSKYLPAKTYFALLK